VTYIPENTVHISRSHFGDVKVSVEQGKKENRSQSGITLTLKEFLDVRTTEYTWIVHLFINCYSYDMNACRSIMLTVIQGPEKITSTSGWR